MSTSFKKGSLTYYSYQCRLGYVITAGLCFGVCLVLLFEFWMENFGR